MSDKPVVDGYKTLCEACTESDEDPKQIGPVRPDTNIGRVRANVDREGHKHACETTTVKIQARTDGGFVFDEVDGDE